MNISISKPVLIAFLVVFFAQSAAIIGLLLFDSASHEETSSTEVPTSRVANSIVKKIEPEDRLFITADRSVAVNQHTAGVPNKDYSSQQERPEEPALLSEAEIALREHAKVSVDMIIDDSIARGTWTKEDTLSTYEFLEHLSPQDMNALREKVGTAINAQRLEVALLPPFM